jgi:HlyD family secretion protein
MAGPGLTALTMADLDNVTLTINVPGLQLGQIALGQALDVHVDAYADRAFPGLVTHISDQAEFTPRNVRSPDQRAQRVYAVKIKIANPDHALKPAGGGDQEIRGAGCKRQS